MTSTNVGAVCAHKVNIVYFVSVRTYVGVPYMREVDEVWWREGRKEGGEPSEDELNQFMGFSLVFKMIVESVSSTK